MLYLLDAKILLGIIFILLINLSACADEQPGAYGEFINPGVEGAIYDGVILFLDESTDAEATSLVQVEIRDLYQELLVNSRLQFAEVRRPTFRRTHGYVTLFVQEGDRVQEGDLLANLSFEDEEFIINRRFAEIRLEQFDRDFAQSLQDRENELANARQRMYAAMEAEFAAASLAFQLLETELQICRRDMQRARQAVYDVLYNINNTIAGDNIYSPINGIITRTIREGTFVRSFDQIVTIVDETSFYFNILPDNRSLIVLPDFINRDAYIRFGDVIHFASSIDVEDEDGETRPLIAFDLKVVNDPLTTGRLGIGWASYTLMPVDIPAFLQAIEEIVPSPVDMTGAHFLGNIYFSLATDAIIIPRGALRLGAGDTHYVMEYIDGIMHKRYVELGVTRPRYVQVISGLAADSMVVVFR